MDQVEQQAEGQVCNRATKNMHRERSHRSYQKNEKNVDFSDFERKAKLKSLKK